MTDNRGIYVNSGSMHVNDRFRAHSASNVILPKIGDCISFFGRMILQILNEDKQIH